MNLMQYIQGFRKGKDAHRLEKEAMHDSFLSDALDGYDKIHGNHPRQIEKLRKKIIQKSSLRKKKYPLFWNIAAGILILLTIGSGVILYQFSTPANIQLAQQMPEEMLDIEMPDSDRMNMPVLRQTEKATEKQSASNLVVQAEVTTCTVPVIQKDEVMVADAKETEEAKELTVTGSVSKIAGKKENFDDYVIRALVRPTDEECKEAKGVVTLLFRVNENGRPYHITVKQSLCPSADTEAVRLLEEGPDWGLTDKEMTKKIRF
ncbi:hypothetical protein FACS1894182_04430 [Bacteroidia bacterium]|nr:hypothetical protein FACS1894182_04430 [Bacteroidia bacterium]